MAKKIISLEFEPEAYEFLKDEAARGVNPTTPEEMIRELNANFIKMRMQNNPNSPYALATQGAQQYLQVGLVTPEENTDEN